MEVTTSIFTRKIATPLGQLLACATHEGLCLLAYPTSDKLQRQLATLKKWKEADVREAGHPILMEAECQLMEYFSGTRKVFDIPLDIPGTEFQQKVWHALRAVPYGTTRSYKQQAHAIGDTNAVRAVARANGENLLSIIIPCHRIIGSKGSIVGYAGGVDNKQWLLKHEFQYV